MNERVLMNGRDVVTDVVNLRLTDTKQTNVMQADLPCIPRVGESIRWHDKDFVVFRVFHNLDQRVVHVCAEIAEAARDITEEGDAA